MTREPRWWEWHCEACDLTSEHLLRYTAAGRAFLHDVEYHNTAYNARVREATYEEAEHDDAT